ncbi:hypothetical protein HJD18_06000 [Thermoleophilia bacterium SCSIO 60948]|nr:hypothetical protein HJD18_06000 [Thermoleophilia bacterium SCSIO 60948]
MRTTVISDLHLGAGRNGDLLRGAGAQEILFERIAGSDRVVLLGDVVELRDRPVADALELAAPFLAALRDALPDAEIVMLAGNHDHRLARDALDERALGGETELGLEARLKPTGAAARLLELAGVDGIELAYPGVWLRDDVYATHGHYLDRHLTVPMFERLGVAMVERALGIPPGGPDPLDPAEGAAVPAHEYERVTNPVYALLYALAQAGTGQRAGQASPSARIWAMVGGGDSAFSKLRAWLLGSVAVPGAVGAANRLGLGPVRSDLTPGAVTDAGLDAMREVVERMRIDAEHVIFGHTHRRGPLPAEGGWRTTAGTKLWNTGSWVHVPTVLGFEASRSVYWPGTIAVLGEYGPPHLEHLLEEKTPEELTELRPDGGRDVEIDEEVPVEPELSGGGA